jgi:UDP-perosamine 4-acetyltransferase
MSDSALGGRLLVIGGGGHAAVVIDVARAAGFHPVAILDGARVGSSCNGVEVIGDDAMAPDLFSQGIDAAVVAIGDNRLRVRLGEELERIGFDLPLLRHPSAIVSPSATVGRGTVIMPLAVINADAVVGRLVIVNTAAVVEHDCVIGDGAHVAPGCRLGGNVVVGGQSLLGIGSVVRPGGRIGDYAVVGAGSTVIADLKGHCIASGSPARVWEAR